MDENWLPIDLSVNLDEVLEAHSASTEKAVGWCLLCDSPIRTEADLIPDTNTHNCDAGRALEASLQPSSLQAE